jgi:putative transposase
LKRAMKEALSKNGEARRAAGGGSVADGPSRGFSPRRAGLCCSISSGGDRYTSNRKPDDQVIEELTRLSESRSHRGFGRMFDGLRCRKPWNHKRVYRVYRELELNLRIKPKRRLPSRNPLPLD